MIHDLIIIGAGAAGLTAGIYAGRALMDTLIIEADRPGGQAAITAEILNYPGVRQSSGPELTEIMRQQTEDFGCRYVNAEVTGLELGGEVKKVICGDKVYESRAVILATGASHRKAGFAGEEEYTGRGVAYCATCDGKLFTGKDVFVIGGGYAAAEEGIFLTRFARSVTMVIRRDVFRCAAGVANKVKAHPKINILFNTEIKKVEGEAFVEKVHLYNNKTGESEIRSAPAGEPFGVFVFAGNIPQTQAFQGLVPMNEQGYIETDERMQTGIPGVYAAGDLRPKVLRQLVTATADGAIAALEAEKYVSAERERLGLKPLGADAPPPPPNAPKQKPKMAAPPDADKGKYFIKGALAAQLRDLFAKMQRPVRLLAFLDTSDKARELELFLREVADCSANVELTSAPSDDPRARSLGLSRFPATVLLNEAGEALGPRFGGVPGGHELTSLALAIYRAGTDSGLSAAQKAKLEQIKRPVKLEIAVSLSCHLCPDVVASCQQLALASAQITAEMIDIGLFPELQKQYRIMSVPCLLINEGEKQIFGAKKTDEILEQILAVAGR